MSKSFITDIVFAVISSALFGWGAIMKLTSWGFYSNLSLWIVVFVSVLVGLILFSLARLANRLLDSEILNDFRD